MKEDKALQQNDDGKWGLYFGSEFPHDVKDYIKYKDKIEWIYFYKCGIGYGEDDAIRNLKLIKLFTNLKRISAYDKTGLTYGQKKELHKIIKKRKFKQSGIIGISRAKQRKNDKLGYQFCCTRSPRSKYGFNRERNEMVVYIRGNGRNKYSCCRYYDVPKFWKCNL